MGGLSGVRGGNGAGGHHWIEVRPLTPEEWPALRRVRLRALKESPEAFASEHKEEAGWREQEWLETFETTTWVVARIWKLTIGVAGSSKDFSKDDDPAKRHVEKVWVQPLLRRRGITRRLINEVIDLEGKDGVNELLIWVLEHNHRARQVYERLGFEPTGERQELPRGEGLVEERLRLPISNGRRAD